MLPKEWIERIFLRFSQFYDNYFIPRQEDEILLWRQGLHGMSPAEIKEALIDCRQEYKFKPPTVIQFFHAGKKLLEMSPSIPSPPLIPNMKNARAHLDNLKSILR